MCRAGGPPGQVWEALVLGIPFCHPSLQKRVSPKLLIGLEFRSR